MAINFPDNPTNGQVFTSGQSSWTYYSSPGVWKITSGTSGYTGSQGPIGYTGSAGPVAGTDKQFVYNSFGSAAGAEVYYDGGKVGIGISTPAEKLSVNGTIQSISGGVKFPDGTTQTTAGASTGKAIAMAMIFGG